MEKTIVVPKTFMEEKLYVFTGNDFTAYTVNGHMTVGRTTEKRKVDIDLREKYVSRAHGELFRDATGVFYVDTDSASGTYVNGSKLTPKTKYYLKDGDVLHIFNDEKKTATEFVCLIYSSSFPADHELGSIDIEPSMAEINIGRGVGKDAVLQDLTVSSNHASFFTAKLGWAVADHNSLNGVFINNRKISRPTYLTFGDCVRIGTTHFIYNGKSFLYQKVNTALADKASAGSLSLDIHIEHRSVWQRAKKLMLLQNINMTIKSGEMVLILGGSGAGKTTFMNAVMGYEKAEGKIMHGDTDIYEDFESMKYKIGFVPQQDLIRTSDSVYDTLSNAAEMKMKSDTTKEERKARIEKVLETLGLQRERNSLVSKLSGGQKKRLSIAVEYIANPSLFFLDEPDSGLDGIMAKSLMQNLRSIADEGKIVMVISHAPDRASNLFDKVVVLAKSVKDNCGHLAFFGGISDALTFFETDSLEGVVKRINRPDEGGDGMSDYYIEKYSKQMSR